MMKSVTHHHTILRFALVASGAATLTLNLPACGNAEALTAGMQLHSVANTPYNQLPPVLRSHTTTTYTNDGASVTNTRHPSDNCADDMPAAKASPVVYAPQKVVDPKVAAAKKAADAKKKPTDPSVLGSVNH